MANQFAIPEIIAYNILPAAEQVVIILLVATPISILIILLFTYKITHKIIEPFDRIIRELDECVNGKRQGPIVVREDDKFRILVEKINNLFNKK